MLRCCSRLIWIWHQISADLHDVQEAPTTGTPAHEAAAAAAYADAHRAEAPGDLAGSDGVAGSGAPPGWDAADEDAGVHRVLSRLERAARRYRAVKGCPTFGERRSSESSVPAARAALLEALAAIVPVVRSVSIQSSGRTGLLESLDDLRTQDLRDRQVFASLTRIFEIWSSMSEQHEAQVSAVVAARRKLVYQSFYAFTSFEEKRLLWLQRNAAVGRRVGRNTAEPVPSDSLPNENDDNITRTEDPLPPAAEEEGEEAGAPPSNQAGPRPVVPPDVLAALSSRRMTAAAQPPPTISAAARSRSGEGQQPEHDDGSGTKKREAHLADDRRRSDELSFIEKSGKYHLKHKTKKVLFGPGCSSPFELVRNVIEGESYVISNCDDVGTGGALGRPQFRPRPQTSLPAFWLTWRHYCFLKSDAAAPSSGGELTEDAHDERPRRHQDDSRVEAIADELEFVQRGAKWHLKSAEHKTFFGPGKRNKLDLVREIILGEGHTARLQEVAQDRSTRKWAFPRIKAGEPPEPWGAWRSVCMLSQGRDDHAGGGGWSSAGSDTETETQGVHSSANDPDATEPDSQMVPPPPKPLGGVSGGAPSQTARRSGVHAEGGSSAGSPSEPSGASGSPPPGAATQEVPPPPANESLSGGSSGRSSDLSASSQQPKKKRRLRRHPRRLASSTSSDGSSSADGSKRASAAGSSSSDESSPPGGSSSGRPRPSARSFDSSGRRSSSSSSRGIGSDDDQQGSSFDSRCSGLSGSGSDDDSGGDDVTLDAATAGGRGNRPHSNHYSNGIVAFHLRRLADSEPSTETEGGLPVYVECQATRMANEGDAELRSLWERREYVEPTGDVARLLSDQAKEDNDDQEEEEPRSTIATRKARNRGQSGGGKKRHEL